MRMRGFWILHCPWKLRYGRRLALVQWTEVLGTRNRLNIGYQWVFGFLQISISFARTGRLMGRHASHRSIRTFRNCQEPYHRPPVPRIASCVHPCAVGYRKSDCQYALFYRYVSIIILMHPISAGIEFRHILSALWQSLKPRINSYSKALLRVAS